jgi:hypothetical protein
VDTCDGLRAPEVLAAVPGLTYRQLDYWTNTERIKPHTHGGAEGSGHPFCYPPDQVALASRMFRLISMGFSLGKATDLAKSREGLRVASRLLLALAEDMPQTGTDCEVAYRYLGWTEERGRAACCRSCHRYLDNPERIDLPDNRYGEILPGGEHVQVCCVVSLNLDLSDPT